MKKRLFGSVCALALPLSAYGADEGERTYRCWRLFESKTGSVVALRATVNAHDQSEAVTLCDIAFSPDMIEPLLGGKQSRLRSEDGVPIVRRTLYMPELARGPEAIAESNRN